MNDADSPADNPAISNLYASCSHGNLHAMKRVLDADGADEIDERRGLDEWNTVGYTNLHFAWYRANNIGGIGIVKLTQFMMIKGADVNAALKINGRDFANSAAFIQGLLDGTNVQDVLHLEEILTFLE